MLKCVLYRYVAYFCVWIEKILIVYIKKYKNIGLTYM